ncbi:MAG: cupin domain-containing protein [Clostridia bacterium]|nr:cupin domain-containing protein [Clostridia bacterium]
MEVKVIRPFRDGEAVWLGLDEAGFRRKVFRVVDERLADSEVITCGLTIFEPGERSSMHNHPGSEEVDFVVRGRGVVVTPAGEAAFEAHDFMFIPKGVEHQHLNTGDEPLWLVWLYAPHGELPSR